MKKWTYSTLFCRNTIATTLLAGTLMAVSSASAYAETTLYVGMNGGTMQKMYEDYVFPPFEKANNVKIMVIPGTSSDVLAKVSASRENPQMNLMFLDDGLMYRAINMGLCTKTELQPEIKEQLYPSAHINDDMATAVSIGLTGLGYNTKMFKENGWDAPTSWNDLADPKYKGKLIFQSLPSSTFGLHAFLMFNRLHNGTEDNVNPGFKAWPDSVGKDVKVYIAGSSKLSEMVQTDEAGIFPITPTLVAAWKAKGIDVAYANPKEGSVTLFYTQCVVNKSQNQELTQKLANWVLSEQAQTLALEHASYIPVNSKVQGAGETKEELKQIGGYMKTAVTLDWDKINTNRPAWNKRWNREIE